MGCRKRRTAYRGRAVRLQETYDITEADYDKLLVAQGGVCAGCGGTRPYKLHIDHDHALERVVGPRASVRGLLCKQDNNILAYVRDNPERLRRLADYLEHPPARGLL